MINNPFTSDIFNTVWSKHFNQSKPSYKFKFIDHVAFYKKSIWPLYINIGKNLTKGIYYQIVSEESDFKGKLFLIYDIPDYFKVDEKTIRSTQHLGFKKVYQYNGYLMDLTGFDTAEAFMKAQFSKKNKRYIRWSHIKRLEDCFDISYEFIYGDVSDEKFAFVFEHFYELLNIRFDKKNTDYHHLNEKKWQFYQDVIGPLIKAKRASFLIIYNEGIPIGANLNYHSEKTLFKAITVFDVDYFKFSIGKLSVIKLLEWCYENEYNYSDFSKGYFDYKEIWGNTVYKFHYHILYDKRSIPAILLANAVEKFFQFKTYLRDKDFNQTYRKWVYKIQGHRPKKAIHHPYQIEAVNDFQANNDYTLINIKEDEFRHLRGHVYTFLFNNPESIKNIKIYKNNAKALFIIQGSNKAIQVTY